MRRKEFLKKLLYEYFVIVTLINVAIFVLGSIFRPDDTFGYSAFLSPLIYGLVSMIPAVLTYSSRELTLKQAVLREILRLFLLEAVLIGFGFGLKNLSAENVPVILGFALSVLVIYFLVMLVSWVLDSGQAKQMTTDLQEFQSRNAEAEGSLPLRSREE